MEALAECRTPDLASGGAPFALCLANSRDRSLTLVSDPYGLQPVYYAVWSGQLIFATRFGPLVRARLGDWSLDPEAILDLFTYEHVTGNRTLAREVQLLGPGQILRFESGGLDLRSYVHTAPRVNEELQVDEVANEAYERLLTSTRTSLEDSDRVAITLSGGLDSRALLGCAARSDVEIQTYTFGTPRCKDVAYAAELSRRVGAAHHVVEIDHGFLPQWLDHAVEVYGGMVGAVHFHILSLADRLAAESQRVLDGLAGDALTGAHLKWQMLRAKTAEAAAACLYQQRASAFASREEREAIFHPDFLAETDYDPRSAVDRHFEDLGEAPLWWGCHRFDLLERQRRFIQFGPHLLRPFTGVETPFYYAPLTGLWKRSPGRLLFEQRAYLRMHARHLPELAAVPDANRGIPVSWPQSIRFGKRVLDVALRRLDAKVPLGLAPPTDSPTDYAAWFRGPLHVFLAERLLDGGSSMSGIIRPQAVEALLREHESGRANRVSQLGCLLSFSTFLGKRT